jgi:hypothetical protein
VDPEINPPHPQSVAAMDDSQLRPPQPHFVFWRALFLILASSRILPFVG